MARWLAWLLFSFHGRLPRKSFWLAQLLLCAASLAGGLIVDGSKYWSSAPVSPWLTGWNFILLFPSLAVAVKRFNDRGRPIWFAAVWFAVVLVGVAIGWSGRLAVDPAEFWRREWALLVTFSIAGLWLFIDLGLLRGERGANQYGVDPLAPSGDATMAQRPARRSLGDNIRDSVTVLLVVSAVISWSGLPFSIPNLAGRAFTWMLTPKILKTWEQRQANTPAMEAQQQGDKAYRAGDFEGAVRHFSRAIELYGPENRTAGWAYRLRAAVLQRIARTQEALSDYSKAIALEPEYVSGYSARADLLIELGRFDNAMQDYAMALQLEPDAASILVERGRLLEKMGRHEKASADFVQAIAAAHGRYDPMIGRAKGDWDRKYWTRTRDKVIVDAHVSRGDMLRSASRGDEALAEYAQALEFGPNERSIYISRGWLNEKQGHLDLARADYEKAATLRTPNGWLKRALERTH